MDPKKAAALDPKLKEIYDRVMSTKVPPPADTPAVAPKPEVEVAAKPAERMVVQTVPQAETVAPRATTHTGSFIAKPQGSGKKSNVLPIILIVFGILFFVGYAIFWIKFFNFPLPFKLPF